MSNLELVEICEGTFVNGIKQGYGRTFKTGLGSKDEDSEELGNIQGMMICECAKYENGSSDKGKGILWKWTRNGVELVNMNPAEIANFE